MTELAYYSGYGLLERASHRAIFKLCRSTTPTAGGVLHVRGGGVNESAFKTARYWKARGKPTR
jgi:hypothetical protein